MRLHRTFVALALLGSPLLWSSPAEAGKRNKDEEVAPEVPSAPVAPPPHEGVFGSVVAGFHPGAIPQGLPSLSAQSCNACHYQAHDDWEQSAHGSRVSAAWRAAADESDTPLCSACHLPLVPQRPQLLGFDADDVNAAVLAPNPTFDATLHVEGVTCAACHVRDGRVIGSRSFLTPPAAHPNLAWSDELASSKSCATCHQLTWEGADKPLYDTYGEWERSGYAAANVSCATCHMGAGATPGATRHALVADLARALTVELNTPGLRLVRGGEPLAVQVVLTNTGAGHAVPTGSPWRALQVEMFLEGPGAKGPEEVGRQDVMLARTLSEAAPWTTTADTRLQAAERRELPWSSALDKDAGPGPWSFVVRIREVVRGQPDAAPALERRLPLQVD